MLLRWFADVQHHPRLSTTWLVAWVGTVGPSRFAYRSANLPWLLLLIGGTWLLARELAGPRNALLAAWIVATLPLVLNHSRKADLHFAAAGLTPLGLWLGWRALGGGWRWAAAFGLWQAARLHVHPVVLPDVAATVLGIAGWLLLRGRRREAGAAVAAALAGSAWYLGLVGDVPNSLVDYAFGGTGEWTRTAWLSQADGAARARLAVDAARLVVGVHASPVLLALGLLVLPGLDPRRHEGDRRWALLGLAALCVLPAPLALLAFANDAFLMDWMYLAPALAVLAVAARPAWAEDAGLRRLWVVALVAHGLVFAAGPWALRAVGPDPLEDPAWWTAPGRRAFVRGEGGAHVVAFHVPVTSPSAAQAVVERAAPGRGAIPVAVVDLTWDAQAEGCSLGALDEGWRWGRPHGTKEPPPLPPWPAVFGGHRGFLASDAEDAVRVVRLWATGAGGCDLARRLPPRFLAAARGQAQARFGRRPASVEDPYGWLAGARSASSRPADYLGAALVDGPRR